MTKRKAQPKMTEAAARELGPNGMPVMTEDLALVFATLLHVGCPPIRAVLVIKPETTKEIAEVTARQWLNDALVLSAMEDRIGGKWMELPMDKRMELARTKHIAEMAFYLWSGNFNDAMSKEEIAKMKEAREVVSKELGVESGDDDPLQEFTKLAIGLVRAGIGAQETVISRAAGKKPPELSASPFDKLLERPPGSV
jgi:hypothetical protein